MYNYNGYAFPSTLIRLKTIRLGSTVVSLPSTAFGAGLPLEDVYCYAELPPSASSYTFDNIPTNCTFHIRPESYDDYMEASPWNNFLSTADITSNMFTIVSAEVGSDYGTITPRGDHNYAAGVDYRYTFSANPGLRVSKLIVDGVDVPDSIAGGSYTFKNLNKNHYIYIEFSIDVGLDTPEADSFSLYPSFANEFVNLSLADKPIESVVVINSVGAIVVNQKCDTAQNTFMLETSSLPAGVYTVVVNGEHREKFIKY